MFIGVFVACPESRADRPSERFHRGTGVRLGGSCVFIGVFVDYPHPSGRDAPGLTESRTGGIFAGPSVRSRGPPGSGRRVRAGQVTSSRAGWPQAKQAARPCSAPICPAFMPATRYGPTVACCGTAYPHRWPSHLRSEPTPRHHARAGPAVSVASIPRRAGPVPPAPPSRRPARPAVAVPSSSSFTPF